MDGKKRYCAYCGREIKDGESCTARIDDYGNTVHICRKCLWTALLAAMSAAAAVVLLLCLLAAVIH